MTGVTVRFPEHPTNKEWDLYDICDMRDPRPPKGASLLIINPGGVLIISTWVEGTRFWGFKPGIPKEAIPPEHFNPEGW